MERLVKKEEDRFFLRFHHLDEWQKFVLSYQDNFNDKPWESFDVTAVEDFVDNYVFRCLDSWVTESNYLEEGSVEMNDNGKKLKYIYDFIGFREEDYNKVLLARIEMFGRFLEISTKDKTSKIILTLDSDDYCKTCAVGKHCQRDILGYLLRNDRDYIFKNSIKSLIKSGYEKDKLGYEGGHLYITPELLFDKSFYQTLWTDISDRGNGKWL